MSNDLMLGTPFNVVGYAMLAEVLVKALKDEYQPGVLKHMMGSAHVYTNHLEGALEQIQRTPIESFAELRIDHDSAYARSDETGKWIVEPTEHHNGIPAYEPDDFSMDHYIHHDAIKFPVAV